jgi:hypothetical protein
MTEGVGPGRDGEQAAEDESPLRKGVDRREQAIGGVFSQLIDEDTDDTRGRLESHRQPYRRTIETTPCLRNCRRLTCPFRFAVSSRCRIPGVVRAIRRMEGAPISGWHGSP